jgi:hypothetical protein
MADRIFCGVRLHPGALPVLTCLPASDFVDQAAPLADALAARGRFLLDRLGEFDGATHILRVLAEFLCHEFAAKDPPKLRWFARMRGERVKDLAAQLGAAPVRTLHASVTDHIGLSPKRFLSRRAASSHACCLSKSFSDFGRSSGNWSLCRSGAHDQGIS